MAAEDQQRAGGRFKQALVAGDEVAVIAEIKRRSPSRGDLNADLDPATMAVAYRNGGAACLSVLTNQAMFGGSGDDLAAAAHASGLPVLRKDFIATARDVRESQAMGADALLLIVADLSAPDLAELHHLAVSLGLDVLTEVKSESELATALEAGADIIGVNQREKPKSAAFTMDYQRAERLAPLIPDHVVKVAESGIAVPGGTTMAEVRAAGYDAALVGEALVTADDPVRALKQLLA
ncbi:indole-3-glycerol phosphate synthase TrpC [Candidatus Poriferisocius sp.]|uniref:indole-3-glycerol phosphate synthase TrpC n=1 Tax=Candidatus Poriferisocius sp. TaxID=3101276 RepID=UPI003B5C5813